MSQWSLNMIPKAQTKYRLNWTSNLKHFCFQGHHEESEKENLGTKKKYLQITWLIKTLFRICKGHMVP